MNTRRTFITSFTLILMATALVNNTIAKSCLWKVTSETRTLYLQGSIHVLTADSYPLAPAIERAYIESDTLVLEANISEMGKPEIQQRIMKKAALPKSTTLQDILAPATYQQLETISSEVGVPIVLLEKLKPWVAATTLTLMKLKQMGFDPQYGLDKYFNDKAILDAKPVIGLESIEFQIELFDSLAQSNPDDFISHTLADLAMSESEMKKLETAWRTGDIKTIGELASKGFKDFPELHKKFVTDRNHNWMSRFSEFLNESKIYMVVVGAGHLSGTSGLLELFRKEGYTLEQL